MSTIPSHGWFMALFCPHYCYYYHQPLSLPYIYISTYILTIIVFVCFCYISHLLLLFLTIGPKSPRYPRLPYPTVPGHGTKGPLEVAVPKNSEDGLGKKGSMKVWKITTLLCKINENRHFLLWKIHERHHVYMIYVIKC